MAKNTTPFSYKNTTYSISTLHLEAIAQAKFNEPFAAHKEEVDYDFEISEQKRIFGKIVYKLKKPFKYKTKITEWY